MFRFKKIKKFIIFILIILIFVFPQFSSADTASESTLTVPQYVRNLYIVGLILIGVVAFGRLVLAGYQYMFGGINANSIAGAKSAFWDVFAGIAVLVSGLLLLRTINPEILNLKWSVFDIKTDWVEELARKSCKDKGGEFIEKTWGCRTATYSNRGQECEDGKVWTLTSDGMQCVEPGGREPGKTCLSDPECQSGVCTQMRFCSNMNPNPIDGPCTDGKDCISGACNRSTNKCK